MEERPAASSGSTPDLTHVLEALRTAAGDGLVAVDVAAGTLRVEVGRAGLHAVACVLRDHPDCLLTYPADLCATDTGDAIVLWYRLWSMARRITAIITVNLPRETPEVVTLTDVWPGLDWHERETFDLFGVHFVGHPRVQDPARMRILLPEDWVGHPFRKDYEPVFSDDPLHGPQETN